MGLEKSCNFRYNKIAVNNETNTAYATTNSDKVA